MPSAGPHRVASEATVADLVNALRNPNPPIRRKAAEKLQAFGPAAEAAIPALIQLMIDDPPTPGRRPPWDAAVFALGAIGPAAIPAMLPLLKLPEPRIRHGAALALAQILSPVALGIAICDREEDVRVAAANSLARLRTTQARELLVRGLSTTCPRTLISIARALGSFGSSGAAAIPALMRLLVSATPYVRTYLAEAVGSMGEPAFEPLMAALQHSDADVRSVSAEVLGQLAAYFAIQSYASPVSLRHVERTLVRLVLALEDGAVEVRDAAARALATVRTAAPARVPDSMISERWRALVSRSGVVHEDRNTGC